LAPPADRAQPASAADPAADPAAGVDPVPLAGFTVAVASDRRRHELAAMLDSAGARTFSVQAVRVASQPDESALREATLRCLAAPVDEVVVSSAFGLRWWLVAAATWQLADALVARFADARLLARDARAADGLRDAGLREIWSTAAASTEELLRYLLAYPLAGRRLVIQLDGPGLHELCHAIRVAGADVVEVPTYRLFPPSHVEPLKRLAEQIVNRQVDAVALTNPGAVESLLRQASIDGRLSEVLNALCEDVISACLGPLTAQPLVAQGVRPLVGAQGYVEDVALVLAETLPKTAIRLVLGAHRVEVRGQALVLDDRLIPVQPGPIAVFRALARRPGRVVSCAEIRSAMPAWAGVDDHAIEMAVSRLRRSLNGADLIQTVMKRGYRLAG
jgi:uroporphyrinogen-III synthase